MEGKCGWADWNCTRTEIKALFKRDSTMIYRNLVMWMFSLVLSWEAIAEANFPTFVEAIHILEVDIHFLLARLEYF